MSKIPFSLLLLMSLFFQMKLSIAILSKKQPFWNLQNLFVLILRYLKVLAKSLKLIFVKVSSSKFQAQ